MSEVIEHLVDTDSAVEEAHRVLRPGGSLLLSTPNLAAWYNRGLLALGIQPVFSEVSLRSVFGRPGSQVAGHLHMFTRRALVEFLAAYGLECVQVAGARYHDVPAVAPPARPGLLSLAVRGLDPAGAGSQGVMLHRLALRARPQTTPAAARRRLAGVGFGPGVGFDPGVGPGPGVGPSAADAASGRLRP